MSTESTNNDQVVAPAGPPTAGTSNNYIINMMVLGTTEQNQFNNEAFGVLILGGTSNSSVNYKYQSDGLLILSGSPSYKLSERLSYIGSNGPLTLSGSSLYTSTKFNFAASGGLILSSDYTFEINYIFGVAIGNLILGGTSNYSYNKDFYISNANLNPYVTSSYQTSFISSFNITWNVERIIEKDLTFIWDIGEESLHWYTVEGICKKNSGCKTTGIPETSIGRIYSRTLAAKNLSDLCFKLNSLNINYPVDWPVTKILRSKKPVYTDTIDYENDGNNYKLIEGNQVVKTTSDKVETYYYNDLKQSKEYDGKFTLILPDSRKIIKNFENGILTSVSVVEVDNAVKKYNQDSISLIKSIPSSLISINYQISRQIDSLGLNDNTMVEQQYCHIPECLQYCIDEDLLVNIGCQTVFTDGFYEILTSGNLNLSGQAICINNNAPSANGGLILSGSSLSNYNYFAHYYDMSGGLGIGGNSLIKYFKWNFTSSNSSIYLSGQSLVVAQNLSYKASGYLSLNGTPIIKRSIKYLINSPRLYLTGSVDSGLKAYKYSSTGGFLIYGTIPYVSNAFKYDINSGLTISGTFIVKSDKRYYTPNSGLVLSGACKLGFHNKPVGGFTLSGQSTSKYKLNIIGFGNLNLSGIALTKSTNFKFAGSGILTLGSSSTTNIIDDTNLIINMASQSSLSVFETVFPEIYGSQEAIALSSENDLINYYDCGCAPLPIKMYLENNLNNSNILKLFMNRNNLSFSNNLVLTYNVNGNSWRNTNYFNGINGNEKWLIMYEWYCDTFNSMNVWNFSITINRYLNNNKYITKLSCLFDKTDPCNNDKIDFYFIYDTNNKNLTYPKGLVLVKSDIKDEIGLFQDAQWLKSPYLKVKITESEYITTTNKKDIYSIFPNG